MDDKLKEIRERVVIDEVHNGGEQLKLCYFLPAGPHGAFNLHNQMGDLLAAFVVTGQNFNITVDDVHFEITDFEIDDRIGSGKWSIPGSVQAAASGSFQASSSGGDVTEVAVPVPPPGAITMKSVTGTSDRTKLANLYFLQVGTTNAYDLFTRNDNLIASGLTSGNNFGFQHDSLAGTTTKINWSVTGFTISPTAASGTWSNNDTSAGSQGGSFQASSSGFDPLTAKASA